MGIRQLEEFLGQADQKGFWIFTYANLGGAFFGAFVGNSLLDKLAPSLKLPGIVLGVMLGISVTWKVKGHPVYRWVLSYLLFVLRRYLKVGLGEHTIDAGLYYRSRAVAQEPFMLVTTRGGRPVPVLVHRGSGAGSSVDLYESLLVPSVGEKAWGPIAGALFTGSNGSDPNPSIARSPFSSKSHAPALAGDEQTRPYYREWGL